MHDAIVAQPRRAATAFPPLSRSTAGCAVASEAPFDKAVPALYRLAFDLARRARWSLGRTALLLIAGTIPFLSFVAERRATRLVREATEPVPA